MENLNANFFHLNPLCITAPHPPPFKLFPVVQVQVRPRSSNRLSDDISTRGPFKFPTEIEQLLLFKNTWSRCTSLFYKPTCWWAFGLSKPQTYPFGLLGSCIFGSFWDMVILVCMEAKSCGYNLAKHLLCLAMQLSASRFCTIKYIFLAMLNGSVGQYFLHSGPDWISQIVGHIFFIGTLGNLMISHVEPDQSASWSEQSDQL